MTHKSHLNNLFIVDCIRTPIGSPFKALKDFSAKHLAAITIKEILSRNNIDKNLVDQIIMGNTVSAGTGQNLARDAAVLSGLPPSTPAFTINNVCGSGLQAVILAAQSIACGDFDLMLSVGSESASSCPFVVEKKNKESKSDDDFIDSLIHDGLWCHITDKHMGNLVENMAKEFNITRELQDLFAYESHIKACYAKKEKKFSNEIVSVKLSGEKIFGEDERPRKNISLKRLSGLPCSFEEEGTVTAGNASSPADGAAAVVLASEKAVKENKLTPKARILGYISSAVEPSMAFTASVPSVENCLKKCGLSIKDIDLFEIVESFAAQALFVRDKLKIPKEKMNIFGGDVALGHPLATAGIRALVTLFHALINQKKNKGLISVCLGGGGAVTLIIEIVA